MKTAKLTGAALDWAVAKCEEYTFTSDGINTLLKKGNRLLILGAGSSSLNYSPSTDWAQGGPIIERKKISLIDCDGYDFWKAERLNSEGKPVICYGHTPLIASMRCYVTSKLGDEVELPAELI